MQIFYTLEEGAILFTPSDDLLNSNKRVPSHLRISGRTSLEDVSSVELDRVCGLLSGQKVADHNDFTLTEVT